MLYIVQTIPHELQQYETVGNWLLSHGHLRHIIVSDMRNEDYAFLVGIHEQIEAWLCMKRGITEKSVTDFDVAFELRRKKGNTDEPGDDEAAPYRREHQFATRMERLLADEMGVDWDTYDKTVTEL